MKMSKLIIVILMSLVLTSCSDTSKVDATAAEIANAAIEAVPLTSGYYKPSDAYFSYYFSDDNTDISAGSIVSDWSIMKSSSQSSENEIGVIIAKDGCLDAVKAICREYLEERREAYLEAKASYSPGEYDKYRDAEYRVYKNCIVYFILNSDDRTAATTAVESVIGK